MHPFIVLLLLPLIGLVVFVLLPLPLAAPIYIIILLLTGVLYWVIIRAMRKRPESGRRALIGEQVRVISKLGPKDDVQYLVKLRGEIWSANSNDDLKPGETVKILSTSGLTLRVGKIGVSDS